MLKKSLYFVFSKKYIFLHLCQKMEKLIREIFLVSKSLSGFKLFAKGVVWLSFS